VTVEPGPPATGGERRGVIHDIGYRRYTGVRLGEAYAGRTLYALGVRHCYGLGRPGRYKVLPFGILILMLLPASIIVGVEVLVGLDQRALPYSRYATIMQLAISIFVATQAPALISRDLRFRTITLYLARPLRRSTYMFARVAALATAVLILVLAPLLLLYVGGLLADFPVTDETPDFLAAVAGAVLLALLLACPSALIAAWTTRRGFAIAAIITTLVVSYTVTSTIQGIAIDEGSRTVAGYAGLFSPYTLVDGLQVSLFNAEPSTPEPPPDTVGGLVFALVALVIVVGCLLALLGRYRRVAAA
jgi:ABC-2 type transport system permease protein